MRSLGTIALATLIASTTPVAAQNAAAGCRIPGVPAPTLCARAGLDTVRAAYVLLVDESGSMRPLWPTVQRALGEFALALPDGDELDVRLFSGSVRKLIAPVPATAATRAEWARTFATLPAPSGMHTDLGAAARSVLTRLQSSPPSRQTFVFFLTDGQHDPGPGSAFPREWRGDWLAIAAEARTLMSARPVAISILRMAPEADQSLLPRTFPQAILTNVIDATQLRAWFAQTTREVAVAKLRLMITEELRQPAFTLSSESSVTLGTVSARTHAARAQAQRTIVTTITEGPLRATLPEGRDLEVRGAIRGGSEVQIVARSTRPWYLPPSRNRDSLAATLVMQSRLEPARELAQIGLDAGPRTDSLVIRGTLVGASLAAVAGYWGAVALLAGLAVWLVLSARWAMYRPALRGQLTIERRGRPDDELIDLGACPRTSYCVMSDTGSALVTLEARARRGRTVVYAIPHGAPLTWRGRKFLAPVSIFGTGVLEHEEGTVHFFLR